MLLGTDQKRNRIGKAQERQAIKFINRILRANRSRNFLGNSRSLNSLMGKHAMQETLMEKVARVHRRQRLERVVSGWLAEGDNLEKVAVARIVVGGAQAARTGTKAPTWLQKIREGLQRVMGKGKAAKNPRVSASPWKKPPSVAEQRATWEATATPGQRLRASLKTR